MKWQMMAKGYIGISQYFFRGLPWTLSQRKHYTRSLARNWLKASPPLAKRSDDCHKVLVWLSQIQYFQYQVLFNKVAYPNMIQFGKITHKCCLYAVDLHHQKLYLEWLLILWLVSCLLGPIFHLNMLHVPNLGYFTRNETPGIVLHIYIYKSDLLYIVLWIQHGKYQTWDEIHSLSILNNDVILFGVCE